MSKFDKIFEARETDVAETQKSNGNKPPLNKAKDTKVKDSKNSAPPEIEAIERNSETIRHDSNSGQPRRGRPAAKRSDPDFVGLTTYVRRDTHKRAKIALLQEGNGKELSELVEELIYKWLEKK
jgi:hypothetical protein